MERGMRIAGTVLIAVLFGACTSKDNDCRSDSECPAGAYCVEAERFCVGCPVGQHPKDDACVDDTVEACGPKGEPCSPPASNGEATCVAGVCDYTCTGEYEKCLTGCCKITIACTSDAQCTASGLICNEKWKICVVADCAGKDDFTPCEAVTDPDRSYDICSGGQCVSPGCGTASCNAPGPHFKLADTNQRKCYDDTYVSGTDNGEIPCPTTNTADFYGQDAQYGWDTIYTEIQRFTRVPSDAGQDLVVDNVTGLVWQGGIEPNKNWSEALAHCNALSWGGYEDWRLPDRYELESIVDASHDSPAIDIVAFPDMEGLSNPNFWSSSSDAYSPDYAWHVIFGDLVGVDDKGDTSYVRCVRSGPSEGQVLPRFMRSSESGKENEPVVTDNVTRLVWQGCAAGLYGDKCDQDQSGASSTTASTFTWKAALAYCEGLDWGGQQGWRLPNMKELSSIVDDRRDLSVEGTPAIDTSKFPGTPADWFWSSSSYAHYLSYAWILDFSGGFMSHLDKNYPYHPFYVRCVRSGP